MNSYKSLINLLSRDYSTLIKRLQDSYKSPINSYKSLVKRFTAKHNKILEYLNLCLLCAIFTSIFYLYIRIKKYFPILKMAEELIGNLGYETWQSDTSIKNSSNAFYPEIASYIWARFTQKNSSQNLVKKK